MITCMSLWSQRESVLICNFNKAEHTNIKHAINVGKTHNNNIDDKERRCTDSNSSETTKGPIGTARLDNNTDMEHIHINGIGPIMSAAIIRADAIE